MSEESLIRSAREHLEPVVREVRDSAVPTPESIHPNFRTSARNLTDYRAMRRHDLRDLQLELSRLGLSSLGRLESHCRATLEAVLAVLHRLEGTAPEVPLEATFGPYDEGRSLLEAHTIDLLGPAPAEHGVRIMVTMPTLAATDPDFIRDLLRAGMNVMRINCAHDHPAVWQQMIERLRTAEAELGLKCRIAFDLAGPKLRTGEIEPGPPVVKWKPVRDEYGRVKQPAFVAFGHDPEGAEGSVFIPVCGDLATTALPGDQILLTDTRDRERELIVADVDGQHCTCACESTGYVAPGVELRLVRNGQTIASDLVAPLPHREHAIPLTVGDKLFVTREDQLGRPAISNEEDEVTEPARIGCTLETIFQDVRPGERIFFDDGKIAGLIRETHPDHLRVEITRAAGGTAKLKAEKGINLPDTRLSVSALTAKDREDLTFAARHGEMVSLSFVRQASDVHDLIAALNRLGAEEMGIVLKIENQQAVHNLPELLLALMARPTAGIMVARGDLGVEISFERMAEIQEEILWFCEAAHIPVIWATQVLESLAKRGLPSRAEVTDAAAGGRAECVMLNKGPHIVEAVRFLREIFPRMAGHQIKKSAVMRPLAIAAPTPSLE